MRLEEAIRHAHDVAKSSKNARCKKNHLVLAGWLEELKERRRVDTIMRRWRNRPYTEECK